MKRGTMKLAANSSKKFNLLKVLSFIKSHDKVTALDICKQTGMQTPTVYRIIHALCDNGILYKTDKTSVSNGRKAIIYSINPDFCYYICIIIEKSTLSVNIADLSGNIRENLTENLDSTYSREKLLSIINYGIDTVMRNFFGSQYNMSIIQAIGIAAEADIDIQSGKIIEFSGMSCLNGFNIVEYMENKYRIDTSLDKIPNIEALACMNELGIKDYIYVHIGAGIGSAIVIDGKIYSGASGKAGELVRVKSPNGYSWEYEYSTTRFYKKILNMANNQPDSKLNSLLASELPMPNISRDKALMMVLDKALGEGIQEVYDLLNTAAEGWANIIYTLYIFFDPAAIIVGGDISSKTPNVFELIRNTLKSKYDSRGLILYPNNEDAVDKAVAINLLDRVFNNIYAKFIGNDTF